MSFLVYLPALLALVVLGGLVVGHQRWLRTQRGPLPRLRGEYSPGDDEGDASEINPSRFESSDSSSESIPGRPSGFLD